MKIVNKLKSKHLEMFFILGVIYIIGAIADAFGFFNWVVNMVGIILQLAALPFILINMVVLFDSGLLPARRAVIINTSTIFILLICMIICWKHNMAAFMITSFIIILLNFIMLVLSVYRLTRLYMEVIEDEKKKNNINTPRASITKFLKYFNW